MTVVYESPDGSRRVSLDSDAAGNRVVEQRIRTIDGRSLVIRHQHPDVLTHPYFVEGVNPEACLYQGRFGFAADSNPTMLEGDIRFKWSPNTRIVAQGFRDVSLVDLHDSLKPLDERLWMDLATVRFPSGVKGFVQSKDCVLADPPERSSLYQDEIGPQELGAGPVDSIRFLVPNGWDAYDGSMVCSPDNFTYSWNARVQVQSSDWSVTIDRTKQASRRDFWKGLKDVGGSAVTHIGELRRAGGAEFEPKDAAEVMESIRLLLNVAVGRRINPVLPVGWRGDDVMWARWSVPPVDRMKNVSSWLDPSIGSKQVRELLECGLNYLSNPKHQNAFRYAASYYVSANADVDVEPAIGLAVSGLQLLAHQRLVNEKKKYASSNAFESSVKNTEGEIREFLNDCHIDTYIPAHLSALQTAAAAMPLSQGLERDALGAVIYLRNKMVHPTKTLDRWNGYAWAEASMVARHFLRLGILNMLGYAGQHKSALSLNRWTGSVDPVPWVE
ncbi:hypothetical protein [Micromonospora globosa]|uniref:hypothetical protein n=1 Tax=Micromonospora globosa TaxID=47863 RepID=UPI0012F85F40|nr:hypothetical protein [Micromonospora globosa]